MSLYIRLIKSFKRAAQVSSGFPALSFLGIFLFALFRGKTKNGVLAIGEIVSVKFHCDARAFSAAF